MSQAETLKFECKVDSKSAILRELKVSVDPVSIQGYIDSSLGRLQKTAAIKGFRKGKVPLDLIKKFYMKDVKADVVKQVVSDSFWKAVRTENILPVGAPQISDIENPELLDSKHLSYVAKVEIFPDIKLGNFSKIKVQRFTAFAGEADVDQTVENLRASHAEVLSSEGDAAYDRPAKNGDTVEMSFEGMIEGKSLDKLKGEHQVVKIGEKRFLDEIEEALVGMKKGEKREVSVTFSKEFPDPLVAGKAIPFQVDLHEIKKILLPALDDEFAKRFQMDTLDEFKTRVLKSITEERETEAKSKTRESLMRGMLETHKFEVPTALVDSELKAMVDDFAGRMRKQGFNEAMIQSEVNRRTDELTTAATDRVRVFLLLERVAEENKIDVTEEDLDKEYAGLSANMGATPEQVKNFYSQSEDALRRLKYRLKEERVVEYLMKQVNVEDA